MSVLLNSLKSWGTAAWMFRAVTAKHTDYWSTLFYTVHGPTVSYIIHALIHHSCVHKSTLGYLCPIFCQLLFFSRETLWPARAPVQIELTSGTWLIRGRPAWCHGQLAFTARVCTANIVSSLSTHAQTQAADAQHAITGGCSLLVSEHRENTSGWQMTLQQNQLHHVHLVFTSLTVSFCFQKLHTGSKAARAEPHLYSY